MYIVESTLPSSLYPHLTDQRYECADIDEAAEMFCAHAPWAEDDARDCLAEGDIRHVDDETGREVTARRAPRRVPAIGSWPAVTV